MPIVHKYKSALGWECEIVYRPEYGPLGMYSGSIWFDEAGHEPPVVTDGWYERQADAQRALDDLIRELEAEEDEIAKERAEKKRAREQS